MYQKVKDFLLHHTISVVSIMDLEGYPHSAALHYAFDPDSFTFYFFTSKNSHKAQTLVNGEIVKASVVIGFSDKEWITIQMEGKIHMGILPDEVFNAQALFYVKFPSADKTADIIPLIFKPSF